MIVPHLVVQTRLVKNAKTALSVGATQVTKATGTFVQVGMRNTVLWHTRVLSFANFLLQVVMSSGNHDSPF